MHLCPFETYHQDSTACERKPWSAVRALATISRIWPNGIRIWLFSLLTLLVWMLPLSAQPRHSVRASRADLREATAIVARPSCVRITASGEVVVH